MAEPRLSSEEPLLRDRLALDRTVLANERTFLAYVRTALAFLITGIGLLKFSQDFMLEMLGIIFVMGSLLVVVVGIRRYRFFRRQYQKIEWANTSHSNR